MASPRTAVRTADIVNGNLWRAFPLINCDKTKDIPVDYPGPIAVPITFLDKHDPGQFEILGITDHKYLVGGRQPYRRIIVRHLHPDLPEEIDLVDWLERSGVQVDFQLLERAELPADAMPVYRRRNL